MIGIWSNLPRVAWQGGWYDIMWYVYWLYSLKDNKTYLGCTNDLERRLRYHNKGHVKSTKHRRPLKLIYSESFELSKDAYKREKYYKSSSGRKKLKKIFGEIKKDWDMV